MATALYLTALEPGVGRSVIALGLMELLTTQQRRVGYFRPVVPGDAAEDDRLALIAERYRLADDLTPLAGVTADEAERQLATAAGAEELIDAIHTRYKAIEGDDDVVVIDGCDRRGAGSALGSKLDARIADRLGVGLCPLVSGLGRSAAEIVDIVAAAHGSLAAQGARLLATFVNRVHPERVDEVREQVDASAADRGPVFVLPETPALARPTVRELLAALEHTPLAGGPTTDDRAVTGITTAAMSLPGFLAHLTDGRLVVTPGDRADVVLAALALQRAPSQPTVAGLVLTDGLPLDPRVADILGDIGDPGPPVVTVDVDAHAATDAMTGVTPAIHADDERKIATALRMVEDNVDRAALVRAVDVPPGEAHTPVIFERLLVRRARSQRQRIVLPEAHDERILRAAQLVDRRGIAEPVLLGDVRTVRARAAALGCDLDHVTVIDPATTDETDDYAERYVHLREHAGVDHDQAVETMLDPVYFAAMMVHVGHADGMVAGAAHTTHHTLRPALEFIRTGPRHDLVSSAMFVALPDRLLLFADCALNPSPTPLELADIASTTAGTAAAFGLPPRVALVSHDPGFSSLGADLDKMTEATKIARERCRDVPVDGPMPYDVAVDADAARTARPDSPVAGAATVLVFPDLHTGSRTCQRVQQATGGVVFGPVLQGLARPVNDLSPSCRVSEVVNLVAITAVQAQQTGATPRP